jgi:hypothetical protein
MLACAHHASCHVHCSLSRLELGCETHICLIELLFRDSEQLLSTEGRKGAGLHAERNSSRRSNVCHCEREWLNSRSYKAKRPWFNTCSS